jgi:hypothetical protein
MQMHCRKHDACFLAPKMLDEAMSTSVVSELLEFVDDSSYEFDHLVDDYLVV